MLYTFKNKKEINKSLYNMRSDISINNFKQYTFYSPTNQKIINKSQFNRRNIDFNQINPSKSLIYLSDKNILNRLNKKHSLTPINPKDLHKTNSLFNLQNKNINDIFNKSINLSKNITLKKIKTFKNFNNINSNNNIGFQTTKNSITNYSTSNLNSKILFASNNNNFSQTMMTKNNLNFSKFFYRSQNKLITSKRIFKHYLREEKRDKVIPIKYFSKNGAPKHIKELKKLYKYNNRKFNNRIREIKLNKTIAFKDDFNILDYQTTLIKLLSKRISDKNMQEFQKNFVLFNEKNFGIVGPKGRFTNLAEKIKYSIPLYLYEKIKKLDTEKLISRYNYYKNVYQNISNKIQNKHKLKKKKINKNQELNNSY